MLSLLSSHARGIGGQRKRMWTWVRFRVRNPVDGFTFFFELNSSIHDFTTGPTPERPKYFLGAWSLRVCRRYGKMVREASCKITIGVPRRRFTCTSCIVLDRAGKSNLLCTAHHQQSIKAVSCELVSSKFEFLYCILCVVIHTRGVYLLAGYS